MSPDTRLKVIDVCIQVVCPPVVTPGDFFVCTADIPRGSNVTFSLEVRFSLATLNVCMIIWVHVV